MNVDAQYENFRNQLDWIISQTPGKSQTNVSQHLGMNDDYINHVRNNHNGISVRRLLQIANYLNTEPQLFFQPNKDAKERVLADIAHDLRTLPKEELEVLSDYIHTRTKSCQKNSE